MEETLLDVQLALQPRLRLLEVCLHRCALLLELLLHLSDFLLQSLDLGLRSSRLGPGRLSLLGTSQLRDLAVSLSQLGLELGTLLLQL